MRLYGRFTTLHGQFNNSLYIYVLKIYARMLGRTIRVEAHVTNHLKDSPLHMEKYKAVQKKSYDGRQKSGELHISWYELLETKS